MWHLPIETRLWYRPAFYDSHLPYIPPARAQQVELWRPNPRYFSTPFSPAVVRLAHLPCTALPFPDPSTAGTGYYHAGLSSPSLSPSSSKMNSTST